VSSWLWKSSQTHWTGAENVFSNSPTSPISVTTITFHPVIYQLEEIKKTSFSWELCNNVQLCWRIRHPFITLRQRGDKDIFHSLRDLMRPLTIHHLDAAPTADGILAWVRLTALGVLARVPAEGEWDSSTRHLMVLMMHFCHFSFLSLFQLDIIKETNDCGLLQTWGHDLISTPR